MKLCSVEGCGKEVKCKGLCNSHYQRQKRLGDPLAGGTFKGEPLNWLLRVAIPHDGDDCLIWPYGGGVNGYGCVTKEGKKYYAHRLVCELSHGKPPTSKHEAAHYCGVKYCVNPRHIRWATGSENSADKIMHGRSNRGEKQGHSRLEASDVLSICDLARHHKYSDVARQFGISESTVYAIIYGRNWSHVTGRSPGKHGHSKERMSR